ncbi:hypothetical protein TL16_g08421 [Triparma laevis f. inornata]|uniref:VWFA domain-containing protein n=2 Tax=Triparma laevis TaxID=1534972 RepID=A0A9W7FH36_9STRA|nr:hypothetical protein TL16_g08421 [Triparma laevis f. inornata]GMI11969.1 hypothetical protein TrLO_g5759 [Triparma laevis f. longispina]
MKRPKRNFLVLMDTSYSMHGDRIIAACDGLDLFHNEVFRKDDYMGLLAFDSRVIMLHEPMMVKKVNRAFDRKNILRTALNGRSTAMYDALHTGLTSLKDKLNDPNFKHLKSGDSVFHVVMLTDGCDNSSTKVLLSSVSALVANSGIPNFHLTVVGISMPRDTTAELRSTLFPRWSGHSAVAELLLKLEKIDVNQVNNDGATPLDMASQNGQLAVVELLLMHDYAQHHQEKVKVKQAMNNGDTPLLTAANATFKAQKTQTMIEIPVIGGQTISENQFLLGLAIESQNKYSEVVKLLLKHGAE